MTQEVVTQLVSRLTVNDKLLRQRNEAIEQNLERMAYGAMVRGLIIGAKKPIKVWSETLRMPEYKSYDIILGADTILDHDPKAILAQAVELTGNWSTAMHEINSIPLWKLIWLKLSRKPLVEMRYE